MIEEKEGEPHTRIFTGATVGERLFCAEMSKSSATENAAFGGSCYDEEAVTGSEDRDGLVWKMLRHWMV